ncbi:MAG: LytTR family DNA-binding domain-containing protein [Acetatifactor sp.]|nr:LytTR family DNA-binding domain-containing protein [Acetatifactor sp.]
MIVRIGIVENETAARDYVQSLIEEWASETGHSLQLASYASAEEFLFKYETPDMLDIVFLDIMLGAMNGMELARNIRKQDKGLQIVFLTGVQDFVFEGYEIGAVRYLLKPVKKTELNSALQYCCEKILHRKEEYFAFRYQGESLRIAFSDILFVRVEGHYLQMMTDRETYEWKGSLAQVSESLDKKRFVFVNRSTIVNLEYVIRITREECFLENGEVLPVSRGAYKALNEGFMEYYL